MTQSQGAANAANTAGGAAGSTGSVYGSMADAISPTANAANTGETLGAASAANGAGGYGIDAVTGQNTGVGPTQNLATYGTQNPSATAQVFEYLDRFNKGQEQSIPEFWKNKGLNPETAGFVFGKLNQMKGSGGGTPQAPPMVTNINYERPENEYLLKRKWRY